MAEPDTQSAQDAGELDEALLRAISHPLRHRLLGMLDGRIASPNQLARELGLPLGRVSYHIRLLSDLGAIELVRTEPRRGALEHFYRAVTTVWFSEGDWAKLPRSARRGILGQNLQQIFTDVTAAADNGGFDHPSSLVLRAPLRLDQAGLDEVAGMLRCGARPRPRAQPWTPRGTTAKRTPPPSISRPAFSSAARKLEGHMEGLRRALVAVAAGSGTGRRVDGRARACPRSSSRWTRRSRASPRSSASTPSCWRCPSGPPRALRPGARGALALFALASLGCGHRGLTRGVCSCCSAPCRRWVPPRR